MPAGLPPPSWPLVTTDADLHEGHITPPWYAYFKSADATWRPRVTRLTSLTTLSDPTAELIPNTGVTLMDSVPATTRTLAAPEVGCYKTLCVTSTSTTGKVTLQSTDYIFRAQSTVAGTTGWKLVFSSSAPYKACVLLGISTFEYLIVHNVGGAVVSTT